MVPAELPELVIDRAHAAPARDEPGRVLQTWLDNDGRLVATGGFDRESWWMRWSGLATFRFGESGPASALPVGGADDSDLHDIFIRGVLPVVLLARGFEALHASAVAVENGVVALCARSGTGKSTLGLALAGNGARQFADDTLVYQWLDGRPVATSLPFRVRVETGAYEALDAPASLPRVEPGRPTHVHRVYQLSRDATLEPGEPRFTPVPPERRFELLLSHAHPFDMGPPLRQRAFITSVMRLAQAVEVWRCEFAPSLAALPDFAARLHAHARS